MIELLAVGAGGFIGSCLRYLISSLCGRYATVFPFGTLISNILAGFLIGFILGAERQTAALPNRGRLFLTTGLLGGLSTFSAFSLETVRLFEGRDFAGAGLNILLNVGISLAAVVLGMAAAGALFKR